ncbi:type II toxin-antitoxin system VapC family toxin [Patescibacteria group bacterium]
MNIVDSSAWLEYFANSKNAKNFIKPIENTKRLIVPTIIIYEIFKKILHEKDEHIALQIIAHLKQGKVVDLSLELSISAGKLSYEHKIPMADAIILATANKYNAKIWTQDADFKGLKNVMYFKKN